MSASQLTDSELGFAAPTRPRLRRAERWRLTSLQRWRQLTESAIVLIVGVAVALAMPASIGTIPLDWGLLAAAVAAVVTLNVAPPGNLLRPPPLALARQLAFTALSGGATLGALSVPWGADLGWVAAEFVIAGLCMALLRASFGEFLEALRADGRLATHVAIVGAGPLALRAASRLEASDPLLVSVVGRYVDLRHLQCDCRRGVVDAVVLAPEQDDDDGLQQLQAALRPCVQDIYLAAELMAKAPAESPVFSLGAMPLLLISRRPVTGWGAIAKTAFDKLVAALLLTFLAPLLGAVALAIKLETPGAVLFRQLRVGYNNELFHIFKFRSMYGEASDRLAKQQTVHGDKRVTRVGRVIRRLSLDELPQLLNVVRGEMSLVGPRPHAPGTSIGGQRVHKLVDNYAGRHRVRPGITGLAQVRGQRGGLQSRSQVFDRVASDLEYIETWSFWLDIKILVLTMVVELRGSHAC